MTSRTTCPNCDQPLYGQYCSNCGQNQKGSDRYFLTLVNEAFEGLFSLDSKAWRTTLYLLFRPGLLTKEHFRHRRARYISPLRLYLITSIAFFLLLSGLNFFSKGLNINTDKDLIAQNEVEVVLQDTEMGERISAQQAENLKKELGELEPSVDINIPFIDGEREQQINQQFEKKIKDAITIGAERPKLLVGKVIDSSPPVLLLLLPLFALVLKLLYLSSNRYYTEHLVLAVHNHSFLYSALFLIAMVSILLEGGIEWWLLLGLKLWVVAYMFISLKTVFEQSWKITIAKGLLLMVIYCLMFVAAMFCITLLGVIML